MAQKSYDRPPEMTISPDKDYYATFRTEKGPIRVKLFTQKAPETVNNFVFLARYRAYDDIPFERVIPGFVVQGGNVGSPEGKAGPGYAIPDEFPPDKSAFQVGSVAMANRGPNTSGSGFFVLTDPAALGGHTYSIFGQVTAGMEVVKAIEADGSQAGRPTVTHKIVKVTIEEKEA